MFFLKNQKNIFQKYKGFTLAEMLVSIFIFSVILTACLSILGSAVQMQRRNLAYQMAQDQAVYATEYIARFARMAQEDSSGNCNGFGGSIYNINTIPGGGGATGLMFLDSQGTCRGFFTTGGKIEQYTAGTATPIADLVSSNKISVNRLLFGVVDAAGSQPKVTISMEILGVDQEPVPPKVDLQTTISDRNLRF